MSCLLSGSDLRPPVATYGLPGPGYLRSSQISYLPHPDLSKLSSDWDPGPYEFGTCQPPSLCSQGRLLATLSKTRGRGLFIYCSLEWEPPPEWGRDMGSLTGYNSPGRALGRGRV